MAMKIVVGLDGAETGDRALTFAKDLAEKIGGCELIVAYVIEWSPFTFQTPEENAERHKRREEELETATTRIVDPAVKELKAAGFEARGIVRHGDVADTLNVIAKENGSWQIIVGRASGAGFANRLFGSATQNLAMHAEVPVTIVG